MTGGRESLHWTIVLSSLLLMVGLFKCHTTHLGEQYNAAFDPQKCIARITRCSSGSGMLQLRKQCRGMTWDESDLPRLHRDRVTLLARHPETLVGLHVAPASWS